MESVTQEEFLRFKKAVIKRFHYLDGLVSDAFQKISDLDADETVVIDEAVERAARAERAVRRLKREFDDHEHED